MPVDHPKYGFPQTAVITTLPRGRHLAPFLIPGFLLEPAYELPCKTRNTLALHGPSAAVTAPPQKGKLSFDRNVIQAMLSEGKKEDEGWVCANIEQKVRT